MIQSKSIAKARCGPSELSSLLLVTSYLLVFICMIEADSHDQQTSVANRMAEQQLAISCYKINSIKRISTMIKLIDDLKIVVKNGKHPNHHGLFSFFYSPIQTCLDQSDAILALEEIIKENINVCSSDHLDKMEHYYKEYLIKPIVNGGTSLSSSSVFVKPLTQKFFMLYANQVSFICKGSMLHMLNLIEKRNLVSQKDFEMASPWLSDPEIMNCKYVPFGQDTTTAIDHPVRRVPVKANAKKGKHCEARSNLSKLSSIEDLASHLDSSDATLVAKLADALDNSGDNLEQKLIMDAVDDKHNGMFLVVPANRLKMMDDMAKACSLKFRPIYSEIVMPLVRLYRMGISARHSNFKKLCAEAEIIKKWFGLTYACETILKSHPVSDTDKYREFIDENQMEENSYVVLDNEDSSENDEESLEKKFDSPNTVVIHKQVNNLMKNSLEDELWVRIYEHGKIQQFGNTLFDSLHLDESHGYRRFRKKVEETKRLLSKIHELRPIRAS